MKKKHYLKLFSTSSSMIIETEEVHVGKRQRATVCWIPSNYSLLKYITFIESQMLFKLPPIFCFKSFPEKAKLKAN